MVLALAGMLMTQLYISAKPDERKHLNKFEECVKAIRQQITRKVLVLGPHADAVSFLITYSG